MRKVRLARNSLQHGLSLPISNDSALLAEAETIAGTIAGHDADAGLLEQARRIGEAQVELNRVRARRFSLVAQLLADSNYHSNAVFKQISRVLSFPQHREWMPVEEEAAKGVLNLRPIKEGEKLAAILDDQASELARLDRYERHALSKRKFAIRSFDSLCTMKII